MNVLIAIDSFKGSISSGEASKAIALGIQEVYDDAEISILPLADGGEGTVQALVQAANGQYMTKQVTGPLGNKVNAVYGVSGDKKTAIIEVAAACGLPLLSLNERNPLLTTTFGVGELIVDAMERGCRKFVIGLGGCATNDAGVGMLQALGFGFYKENNEVVGFGGQVLEKIGKIDTTSVNQALWECEFQVACDVNNPLYGDNGAAYVFGPQKGATPEMVQKLDHGLRVFADVVMKQRGTDMQSIAGAGAAGGLGAAFAGFLHAKLDSGIQLVLEHIGLEQKLQDVGFVITGEGRLDEQTSMGKAPLGVAKLAHKHGIPVIALAGGVTREASILNECGITAYFSIMNKPMSLEEAMDEQVTFDNLRHCSLQLFKLIKAIRK